MISPEKEYLYNIVLSIFFAIVLVFVIDSFFNKPRTIIVYKKDIQNA